MQEVLRFWPWISWLIGAFVAGALLLIGHWFPWPDEELERIPAYVYGVVSLFAGFTTWRLLLSLDWQTPLGLAVICAVGGLAVILAYRIDDLVKRLRKASKAESTDDEL